MNIYDHHNERLTHLFAFEKYTIHGFKTTTGLTTLKKCGVFFFLQKNAAGFCRLQ